MAYGVRAVLSGMTREQHDAMIQQLGPLMRVQDGFIAHASGPAEDGWFVLELWESRDAHERWVRETIVPAMQAAGAAPFRQETLPVHNAFAR